MQVTKLLWFAQVLSKNMHGRAVKWGGDITQPASKADFLWRKQSARAKSKDCRKGV